MIDIVNMGSGGGAEIAPPSPTGCRTSQERYGVVVGVAYAFEPRRMAILLVAGDKSGVSQKRFYRTLITTADGRFDRHLAYIRKKESK